MTVVHSNYPKHEPTRDLARDFQLGVKREKEKRRVQLLKIVPARRCTCIAHVGMHACMHVCMYVCNVL